MSVIFRYFIMLRNSLYIQICINIEHHLIVKSEQIKYKAELSTFTSIILHTYMAEYIKIVT